MTKILGASAWKSVNKTLTVDIGEIEVPREQKRLSNHVSSSTEG